MTAFVAILGSIQAGITAPPFTSNSVVIAGAIITFLVIIATGVKNYLSPDVSTTGNKFTIWALALAALGGVTDLLNIFNLSDSTDQRIRLIITILVMAVNILAKQIFPSTEQKQRMAEAKYK